MRWRTIVVSILSYAIAAFAAALAVIVLITLIDLLWRGLGAWPSAVRTALEYLPAAVVLVLVAALFPFLAAISLLHWLRRSDWLAHLLAGLLVSLVAQLILAPGIMGVIHSWPILVGGAVAGLVYWAARRALTRAFGGDAAMPAAGDGAPGPQPR